MAKRARPLDDPPSPTSTTHDSSSDDDEQHEEETPLKAPPKKQQQPQPESEDDEEEEEEEVEEEVEEVEEEEEEEVEEEVEEEEEEQANEEPQKPQIKNPEPDSESDAETESDSDSHVSQRASDYTIKPVPKPAQEPKSAKKSVSLEAKAKAKEDKVSKPEKAKKVSAPAEVEEEEQGDNGRKAEKRGVAINRKWSYDDEIKVLEGIIDFIAEFSYDPSLNSDNFYRYVKDSVKAEFTKAQVMDKFRRLKKKYKNALTKYGKDAEISNPHEYRSFHLSKQIWGNMEEKSTGTSNAKSSNVKSSNVKSSNAKSSNVKSSNAKSSNAKSSNAKSSNAKSSNAKLSNAGVDAKANVVALPVPSCDDNVANGNGKGSGCRSVKRIRHAPAVSLENNVGNDQEMMEVEKEEEKKKKVVNSDLSKEKDDFVELYPNLMKAFEADNMVKVQLLDGLKSCLSNVGSSELKEWDKKWKKVQLAEAEVYVKRLALIQEQTTWFVDAMRSSMS